MPTFHRLITVCTIACSLAAPAVAGAQQDLRSPDARDASPTSSFAGTTSTPIEQALAQEQGYMGGGASSAPTPDLRSPDARDAAGGRGTFNTPDVTVVKVREPAPVHADGGVDWADAGIGAAILLAALAVAFAAATAIVHRRRHRPRAVTAA